VALKLTVRIQGADEVLRALAKLPRDAEQALREQARDIAETLADRIYYAGRREGRQAARAATTVKAVTAGAWPAVQASNTGRAKGLLFGSEFGMNRKSGWYRKPRYFDSPALQFKPHRGAASYWFFATSEANQPWVESEWHKAADEVVRRWSA
jgi:hypothetical protein